MPLEHPIKQATGCKCIIVDVISRLQSIITVSDEGEFPHEPDEHALAWEALYVPSAPDERDPNKAPTEIASHLPLKKNKESCIQFLKQHMTTVIKETVSPEDPAMGIAVRVDAKERMTQTPPLLSRLIQGYLDHTGIEACPHHQMDHGVRDPDCDHCKRALGPLYHHKIVGNRHLPVFTFDFSGPHPHRVNMAQYLPVSVWSLGHMRIIWAFGVESRQSSAVLPCLQSCFEDLTCADRRI